MVKDAGEAKELSKEETRASLSQSILDGPRGRRPVVSQIRKYISADFQSVRDSESGTIKSFFRPLSVETVFKSSQ